MANCKIKHNRTRDKFLLQLYLADLFSVCAWQTTTEYCKVLIHNKKITIKVMMCTGVKFARIWNMVKKMWQISSLTWLNMKHVLPPIFPRPVTTLSPGYWKQHKSLFFAVRPFRRDYLITKKMHALVNRQACLIRDGDGDCAFTWKLW